MFTSSSHPLSSSLQRPTRCLDLNGSPALKRSVQQKWNLSSFSPHPHLLLYGPAHDCLNTSWSPSQGSPVFWCLACSLACMSVLTHVWRKKGKKGEEKRGEEREEEEDGKHNGAFFTVLKGVVKGMKRTERQCCRAQGRGGPEVSAPRHGHRCIRPQSPKVGCGDSTT